MDIYNLVSLLGLVVLVGIGWLLSADRRRMNWRAILFGVGLQLAIGALVFWVLKGSGQAGEGTGFFGHLNDGVLHVLTAAQAGQKLLFGPLADEEAMGRVFGQGQGFVLALQALPVIIFFAALMELLYHWRIMPQIVRAFAWLFSRLMRISGAESLCTASNIFVGIESVTTIRPYLLHMTRSELCMILTAGMATVASSTMAVYVGFLRREFPTIAGHLISASLMSAPAAIVMAKVLVPETEAPETLGRSVAPQAEPHAGSVDAIIAGATAGVRLLVGIVALLIAFLGLIALIDLLLAWIGGWFASGGPTTAASAPAAAGPPLSLSTILGYVFRPLAAVMGVPWHDAALAGEMLGKRLVATEIPAYLQLGAAMKAHAFSHPRSAVIVAYALCGFAHVASLAIFVGGVAALVPQRRADLAAVGPRALLAATLACLMTGAVAGVFFLR